MIAFPSLPDWTAYVLVALLLGLPGIALAWPFRRRVRLILFYSLLPAIFLTPSLSKEVVVPKLRDARITNAFNANLPMKFDEYTTVVHGTLSEGNYVYYLEVDALAPYTTAEQLKARNKSDLCSFWGPQFKDRSVRVVEYRYKALWGEFSYDVTNRDCL